MVDCGSGLNWSDFLFLISTHNAVGDPKQPGQWQTARSSMSCNAAPVGAKRATHSVAQAVFQANPLFLMDHVITVYGSWTDAGSGADGGEGNEDEAPEDPR